MRRLVNALDAPRPIKYGVWEDAFSGLYEVVKFENGEHNVISRHKSKADAYRRARGLNLSIQSKT